MSKLSFVIMAGGRGERMNSETPKPLREIAGKTMLERVVESARCVSGERIIVVSGDRRVEEKAAELGCLSAWQEVPLGTADALAKALPHCFTGGEVMIACADIPLVPAEVFREVYETNMDGSSYLTVLTATPPDPFGYGRVIKEGGRVVRIVEEKEASGSEKNVGLVNSGIYCVKRKGLDKYLSKVKKSPLKGEYYLTDLVHILIDAGEKVGEVSCDWGVVQGVNTPAQLDQAELMLKNIKGKKCITS